MFHTLAVVVACWCIVYIVDKVLRQFEPLNLKYLQCQDRFGLNITFAYMRCYTTRLNSLFKLWACCNRRIARTWFNIGVCIGLSLMVLSVLVLLFSLYQALFSQSKTEQVLIPVMPGVNVPWSQITHYFFTLVICGVFHEVGHALAAVTEQVRINGFGLFIFFLYPGAFVDLHSDHLTVISPKRQLRIYCAGVWHNIILSLLVFLFSLALPYLLLPFYTTGNGAVVINIAQDSVLQNKLSPGVVLTQLDSCSVHTTKDWSSCLQDKAAHIQRGYCISKEFLDNQRLFLLNETRKLEQDGGIECCTENTQSDLCFNVGHNGHYQLSTGHARNGDQSDRFACLTARQVVSDNVCLTLDDCTALNPNFICVMPALGDHTHLVNIKHTGSGDSVLFLGDLRLLEYTLTITDYQPSSTSFPLWLPRFLETLCIYIISISSALALMNMVPAYALDGQWTLGALLEHLIPENPHRTRIFNSILIFGSLLLLLNILLAFWILINW